jgi:hypothetical protein
MKDLSLEQKFVIGSKNATTMDITDVSKAMVIRGVTSKTEVDTCVAVSRDFYYIDTGYLGNFPSPGNLSGKKLWHRVVKNENQLITHLGRPDDRWKNLVKQDPKLAWQGWKSYDKKILLVLPNPKACRYYDVDFDTWIRETEDQIKTYSNLPIETRIKGSRSDRNHKDFIYDVFDQGVYATVSLNSIASLESVLYGIPSFVSVPCAASSLCSNDLSLLKNPYRPTEQEIMQKCYDLAYGQFTTEELLNGTAYDLVKD